MTTISQLLNVFRNGTPWLEDRLAFLTLSGSRAYGTNTPDSDYDYKGFCVPPVKYFLGFHENFENANTDTPCDIEIFNLKKLMHLLAEANPNILEIVFTDPSEFVYTTEISNRILSRRKEFLSKKVRWTYSGYAVSQLNKIKSHRRWLFDPPDHMPTRQEFGLPDDYLIEKHKIQSIEDGIKKRVSEWELDLDDLDRPERISLSNQIQDFLKDIAIAVGWNIESNVIEDLKWFTAATHLGYDSKFIDVLAREREYKKRKQDWNKYQEWLRDHDSKRARLEKQFGYDVKKAAHIVRLYRTGVEILTTGNLQVRRPDAEELLAIRRGAWKYEELVDWTLEQDQHIKDLYNKSTLPKEPHRYELDKLCVEVIDLALHDQRIWKSKKVYEEQIRT
jgi:hypothetical protein